MTTKKLKLEDFLAPALSDEPTKLFIQLNGKATKEYLLVICSNHKDLKRPLMQYGLESNKLKTKVKDIEDEVDRLVEYAEGEKTIDQVLSAKMVVGWSLGTFNDALINKLLDGNNALVKGIQAQSYTAADYIKKK